MESGAENVARRQAPESPASAIGERGSRMIARIMSQIPRYQPRFVRLPTSSDACGSAATARQKTTRRASLRMTCRKLGSVKLARLAAATA